MDTLHHIGLAVQSDRPLELFACGCGHPECRLCADQDAEAAGIEFEVRLAAALEIPAGYRVAYHDAGGFRPWCAWRDGAEPALLDVFSTALDAAECCTADAEQRRLAVEWAEDLRQWREALEANTAGRAALGDLEAVRALHLERLRDAELADRDEAEVSWHAQQ